MIQFIHNYIHLAFTAALVLVPVVMLIYFEKEA